MTEPDWYAAPKNEAIANPHEIAAREADFGVVYGDFFIRALARIIDFIADYLIFTLGMSVGGFVALVLIHFGALSEGSIERAIPRGVPLLCVSTISSIAYHSVADAVGGATIGKFFCGLRTLRADLIPCSIGAAIGRNAAFLIDSFFFGLIASHAMRRSKKKQRLGDQWAGTVVAVARTLPPRARARNVWLGIAAAICTRMAIDAASLLILAAT